MKIDSNGHITLDSAPMASADALVQSLRRKDASRRAVRVAVSNAIEQLDKQYRDMTTPRPANPGN